MRKKLLVFGSPAIENAEIDEVAALLQLNWLGAGSKVIRFEWDFTERKGVEHAAALNYCTGALQLSILAAGIEAFNEVITTPLIPLNYAANL